MQKYKCLIIDDEELAQDVIKHYLSSLPMLELVGTCKNAVEAITHLCENHIDIIFLDINMPEINGLEMLKTLTNPPKTILTTAYSNFAIESYEYGVVDYLLKPFKLDRFIKAVNRAIEQIRNSEKKPIQENAKNNDLNCLFIKEDYITHNVEFAEIQYIQAYGNYLKLYSTKKTYIVRETLQNILEKLPEKHFIKIHKSYVVSIQKIQKIIGNYVIIENHEIPIGITFKNSLIKRINELDKNTNN